MRRRYQLTLGILSVLMFVSPASIAGTGAVVFSGKSTDGDIVVITLTTVHNKWTESEPAGASKVFKTKSGCGREQSTRFI
jgi:hypothetical protein